VTWRANQAKAALISVEQSDAAWRIIAQAALLLFDLFDHCSLFD